MVVGTVLSEQARGGRACMVTEVRQKAKGIKEAKEKFASLIKSHPEFPTGMGASPGALHTSILLCYHWSLCQYQ